MVFDLKLLCTLLCLCIVGHAQAQANYIDYNPQYKTWAKTYQIDKIKYENNNIVIYFRFVKENSKYQNAIFYPANHEFAWVLETTDGQVCRWNSLRNIAKNGVVQLEALGNTAQKIEAFEDSVKNKTVFTCEIHFKAFSDNIAKVSLVEGQGLSKEQNLNCLDIVLKNNDLGNAEMAKERIGIFEFEQVKNSAKKSGFKWDNPMKMRDFELKELWEEDLQEYTSEALIDEKPIYTQWDDKFFLDRIIYTKNETIFCARFAYSNYKIKADAYTLYGLLGEHPWFLEDISSLKRYPLLAVTNIRRNGNLERKKLLHSEWKMEIESNEKGVLTCQIHFEKLPKNVKRANIIEGVRKSKNTSHFNFFDIMLLSL